jgi:hypothetical protein
MSNLETITVSVDSSFKNGYGACAYYIKHEKFVVKDAEFLGNVGTNVLAEFQGITRALVRCINESRRRQIKKIYVTCDCIPALKLAEYDNKLKKLIGDREVIYQHIDAHSGVNSPRQYVNDWCDKSSRNCLNSNLIDVVP